jgi:hypothetical protein
MQFLKKFIRQWFACSWTKFIEHFLLIVASFHMSKKGLEPSCNEPNCFISPIINIKQKKTKHNGHEYCRLAF